MLPPFAPLPQLRGSRKSSAVDRLDETPADAIIRDPAATSDAFGGLPVGLHRQNTDSLRIRNLDVRPGALTVSRQRYQHPQR
jgi:hypothetical protein